MSTFEEVEQLLSELDAFVAGGKTDAIVSAAEDKLAVSFPPSFREYLLRWGNVSCDGYEYYGLTQNDDFDNASVPNFVWFTLKKRRDVGLPQSLLVFRNENDEEYLCIDTSQALDGDERKVVIWDNIERSISRSVDTSFIEYIREELLEVAEDY
ncbi:SMI1/KNR4 family protein [Bremerella sp.]|uniref:SMI1/KNR4 family protein n=1 Tax=Bremerella sp. TaxID=2795602 RepID=UPI00391A13A0